MVREGRSAGWSSADLVSGGNLGELLEPSLWDPWRLAGQALSQSSLHYFTPSETCIKQRVKFQVNPNIVMVACLLSARLCLYFWLGAPRITLWALKALGAFIFIFFGDRHAANLSNKSLLLISRSVCAQTRGVEKYETLGTTRRRFVDGSLIFLRFSGIANLDLSPKVGVCLFYRQAPAVLDTWPAATKIF